MGEWPRRGQGETCRWREGPVRSLPTRRRGGAVAPVLGEQDVTMAVCEPTGGYERPLVAGLQAAGAAGGGGASQVLGTEAKTDLLDARPAVPGGGGFRAPAASRRSARWRSPPPRGSTAPPPAYLPELGQTSGPAVTALVGLAPWARDSGRQRAIAPFGVGAGRCGARCTWRLGGGAPRGELQRFYQGLRQRGKPGKVALVAVMRKLLLHPQRGGPPGHPLDRGTRARSLKALDGQHRYSRGSGNPGPTQLPA